MQVKDISTGATNSFPDNLVNVGGQLFFTAANSAAGREIWKSDGTAAGTVLVKDIGPGSSSAFAADLTAVGSSLFFTQGAELWKSDGTSLGTNPVEPVSTGSSSPSQLKNVNGTLFFSAFGVGGNELWKSDGTATGTTIVSDIFPGGNNSSPAQLMNIGSTLYFVANAGATTGRELFVSDGTSAGTVLVQDILPGSGTSNPESLTALNGRAYFVATNSVVGREFFGSDGTSAGTGLVADINKVTASTDPTSFVTVGSSVFFVANNGVNGLELWKSDGTLAGTSMVKDIQIGAAGSSPSSLINVNGTLYFVAQDTSNGRELWKSDGTAAGTVLVANIQAGAGSSSPQDLAVVGSTLFFTAIDTTTNGRELWKSNGTAGTTTLVKDINPTANTSSNPQFLTPVGSTLFFSAADSANGRELWSSDGTTAGTVLVSNLASTSASSNPENLTAVGSNLFFTAAVSGRRLWRSNGTGPGTEQMSNTLSSISNLINLNGNLLFAAIPQFATVSELFVSDGTAAGTVFLGGDFLASPSKLTRVGNSAYFTAYEVEGSSGVELWKTDGTSAGTSVVKDIVPGPADAAIDALFNVNGTLVFSADEVGVGRELWQSDGTSSGTRRIVDLNAGAIGSIPVPQADLNGKLIYVANDGSSGRELFVLSPNQAPTNSAPVGPLAATEDQTLSLSGFSVSDPDADAQVISVTLSVTSGALNVSTSVPGGVVAANVTGNNTASVTVVATQAALNATFANVSGLAYAPAADFNGDATLTMVTSDLGNVGLGPVFGTSSTVTINIAAVNDNPVLGAVTGSVATSENSPAIVVSAGATLSDIDSPNFDGGIITVALSTLDLGDRLAVLNEGTDPGQVSVSGADVSVGGVIIGSITSSPTAPTLQIALNASADAASVQAVLRKVTFEVLGDTPATAPRTAVFSVTDGDGGTSASGTVTINVSAVNDAPVLQLNGAPTSYSENASPVAVAPAATLVDPESNFSGGTITVSITANATADDRLQVASQGFAAGQISVANNFLLFGTATGPINVGSLAGGVGLSPLVLTLNSNATGAAVEAIVRAVTFQVLSDAPSALQRTVAIEVSDSDLASSGAQTNPISVVASNDLPVIAAVGPTASYTENAVATVLAPTAAVSDADSLTFTSLQAAITANLQATDVLAIRNQGIAAGQIGVTGNSVTYEGVTIGTFVGGTNAPLVVTLNASATATAVTALVRNITYRSTSENPAIAARTVTFTVTDDQAAVSTPATLQLNVVAVNDRPVLSNISGTLAYTENSLPVAVAPTANLADPDSADFQGGNLTVRYLSGSGSADDRLAVIHQGFGAGQIGVAGLSILYGGQTIGTFTGGTGTTQLRVFLNAFAGFTTTKALLQAIGYSNVSDNPATNNRVIEFLLNDGDGGTSVGVTKTVTMTAVNDAPIVTLTSSVQNAVSGAPEINIDGQALVSDVDSADLAGGVLTVSLSSGAAVGDVLSIRNEGTGAGQIGISGNTVTFGGIAIGTFTASSSSSPLTVSLNSSATPTAVQALLRRVTFQGLSLGLRTIAVQLTDGDGGTSALVSRQVNVN